MFRKKPIACAITGAILSAFSVSAHAETPTKKMTPPIPDGPGAPDNMDTSIGTLTLKDGIPTPDSVQTICDTLDAARARLNFLPIASMAGMRDGLPEMGTGEHDRAGS